VAIPPVVADVVIVIVVATGTAVAAAGTAIAAAAAAVVVEVAAGAPYRSTAVQSSHMRTSRPTFLGPTNDHRCNLSQTHAVASPQEQEWRLVELIWEWERELALAEMELRQE
jgi:hypothetical protein